MTRLVNLKRESEASATRVKNYGVAKAAQDALNRDLLPKLREQEALLDALWKEVAPVQLVHSVSKLQADAKAHARDAANARDYVTARSLTEAHERLAAAATRLRERKEDADIMEVIASRANTVAYVKEQVNVNRDKVPRSRVPHGL